MQMVVVVIVFNKLEPNSFMVSTPQTNYTDYTDIIGPRGIHTSSLKIIANMSVIDHVIYKCPQSSPPIQKAKRVI